MAEQRTEIRFTRGTDESDYTGVTKDTLVVTNAEYSRDGGLVKRAGWAEAGTYTDGAQPVGFLPTRGGLLALRKQFAAYADAGASATAHHNWHSQVRTIATHASQPSSTSAELGWTEVDAATLVLSGTRLVCTVVSSNQRNGHWSIATESGRVLDAGALASAARMPRVVALGSTFRIYYAESGVGVKCLTLTPALTGNATEALATVVSDAGISITMGAFDACGDSGSTNTYVTFVTGADIAVHKIAAGASVANVLVAHGGGTHRLGICVSGAGTVHVIDGRDATTYRIFRFSSVLLLTDTTVPSGQTNRTHTRVGIAVCPASDNPGLLAVAYEDNTYTLCYSVLSTSHAEVAADRTVARTALLSKPAIELANGSSKHDSTEPVYFVVLGTRDLTYAAQGVLAPMHVCRLAVTAPAAVTTNTLATHDSVEPMATLIPAGGNSLPANAAAPRGSCLPRISSVRSVDSADNPTVDHYIPVLVLQEVLDSNGADVDGFKPAVFAAAVLRLEHGQDGPAPSCSLGGIGFTGGGLLRAADGVDFGEVAILRQPPAVVTADAGAGGMGAGTYGYYQVWTYTDLAGRVRRSSPSVVATQTIAASHQITVTAVVAIPTMLAPSDDTPGGQWGIEIYRTDADGSVGRLVHKGPTDVSGTITFNDNYADASTASNRILYTDTELAAEPAPPARHIWSHGNRLWVVDARDPRTVWYSKELEEGRYPEFNGTLKLRLDGANSDIECGASLDDKVVLFTQDAAYIVTGAGPDRTGAGTFNPPELVTGHPGVSGPHSAQSIPLGIITHARSGMWLLGRDLQAVDISGPIRERVSRPRSSAHVPSLSRVYWVLDSNLTAGSPLPPRTSAGISQTVLVFDYARGGARWLLHTSAMYSGQVYWLACADYNGQPAVLGTRRSSNAIMPVLLATAGTYTDGASGAGITMTVEVRDWKPIPALLTEVRLRRVHVMASSQTSNADGITLAISAQRQLGGVTPAAETHPWTDDQVNDGNGHLQVRPKRQRLTSAKFTVSASVYSDGTIDNPGPVLHGLVLDWEPTRPNGGKATPAGAPTYS